MKIAKTIQHQAPESVVQSFEVLEVKSACVGLEEHVDYQFDVPYSMFQHRKVNGENFAVVIGQFRHLIDANYDVVQV